MAAKKTVNKSAKKKKTGEVWPVTVYLLKSTVKSAKDALHKNSKAATVHTIPGLGGLVLKDPPAVEPVWAKRFATLVPPAASLRQRSPGAVLFVDAASEMFAITFGYGRSLLAPEALVHDFGIRVVLNSVDASLIRSLDSRTLEVSPQLSRKQFVRGRPLAAFALDQMHELVKGVTGKVKTAVTKFDGELITGTDSLQCRVRINTAKELVACCADFLGLYKKKDYQASFAFVDHIQFVRDPAEIKKLDGKLLAKAKVKATLDDFGFAPPVILDGAQLVRLRCSWDKGSKPGEIKMDLIRARLQELAKKSTTADEFVSKLKRDRVELCGDDTGKTVVDHWSLYRCLLVEVVFTGTHILTSGDWYDISKGFIDEIGQRFDKLVAESSKSFPIKLPKQSKTQTDEETYNADTATLLSLENCDKTSLTTGLGASQVEPCDLLDTKNGIFVHVKIGRSSGKLSHLFNQGLTSAFTFLGEQGARDIIRKLPMAASAPAFQEPIQASDLATAFAIIDKAPSKGTAWRLPFFSMLVACSVTERISQRGMRVYTVRVDAA